MSIGTMLVKTFDTVGVKITLNPTPSRLLCRVGVLVLQLLNESQAVMELPALCTVLSGVSKRESFVCVKRLVYQLAL